MNDLLILGFQAVQSFVFWSVVALGACIGSFLNVVILRLPERTFFKNARSVCPTCGVMIPFYFNIPVVGYFILRGKANCCGTKISWHYPAVEFATAVIFGLLYLKFPFSGWSVGSGIFEPAIFVRWAHAAIFISLMLAMSVIDAKLMIIPDELSIGMIVLSPLVAWIHPDLTLVGSLIGIAAGGGLLYGVAWSYWFVRKQYGLGFGDVKLLAAIGGWLGWQSILPTLFLGSIVGSIIGIAVMVIYRQEGWQSKIPFGPFLALGAVTHLIFGPEALYIFSGGQ